MYSCNKNQHIGGDTKWSVKRVEDNIQYSSPTVFISKVDKINDDN